MVKIHSTYDGSLRCNATHGPSETSLATDAPKDNEGLGASFSPTDLVATALQTCALTTMAIVAKREGFEFGAATSEIEKVMVADPKRRIGALPMRIDMPAGLTTEQREKLENAAKNCPVAMSIRESIEASIEFAYPD